MSQTFTYRARESGGQLRSGVLVGTTASAVARDLAGMGLVPLEVKPAGAAATQRPGTTTVPGAAEAQAGSASQALQGLPVIGPWLQRLSRPREKRLQQGLGLVLRELASLLRAGVPLMRALKLAADSSADAPVREGLQRIYRDLDNGHTLVVAAEREHRFSGLLSDYDVAMLQVGERTGRLPETFADLHRHREFVAVTQEQVASALRYPAFVIVTCLLALVIVNLFVIPSFAKVFAQARAELPLLTQVLLSSSQFMVSSWPWLLAAGAGAVLAWTRFVGTPAGRLWWDRNKLRLPIVGPILQGIVLARLTGSLASSISAGLTITDALAVTGRTLGNLHFEDKVNGMCHDLARGNSITAAARAMGVLPPTLMQLFALGEESGSLEELMREISLHYRAEVDHNVKRLASTIEPVMVWILGMGVLVLALGIFMPMWDLGKASLK
jgi:MSHA biogenesis protein MshG